ncbi:MAG TPA: hypothetical protein VFT74_12800, partial [Isosphaeraceae bacterium]|nr:hypothetical protein [Isosphaeraceae bacterium]
LDNLEQTTGRELYRDHIIGQEIRAKRGDELMELRYPGGELFLKPGQAHADVDQLGLRREMIRRTIREHLDKEMRLRPQGIKVLSLFFIDSVEKYRKYNHDGRPEKGEYARVFEEEYRRAAKLPEYHTLFEGADLTSTAEEVHGGYFSIDRKGHWLDTAENNQSNRDNAERAYNLIMKDKEDLLSFKTRLKFLFSHSALKEGWDNPNVFQICALRDMSTERERRQTIGRGLRLCVNQNGDRLQGFEYNTLTVIATETYEQFAENLQKEIELDTGIRFGVVEPHQFALIAVKDDQGQTRPLGAEQSEALHTYLKKAGHLDARGRIQDSLRKALKDQTLALPQTFQPLLSQVEEVLRKLAGKLEIKNADERKIIRTRQAVLDSEAF